MENHLTLKLLEAKTGDSFIVECGLSAFIIDGGTNSTSKQLKKYLENTDKQLAGIFVTHVDRDHIGGIVKLFTNNNKIIPKNVPIYMNHPDLIRIRSKHDEFVSFEDGDKLNDILRDNGFNIHNLRTGDSLDIQNVKFEILNPTNEIVTSLYKKWEKLKIEHSQFETDDLVSSDPITIDFSTNYGEHDKTIESDIVNASSICFILSYNNKRILFLSDSHPNLISQELKGNNKFECVKISHHGSKFNTSIQLLDKIDCNKFIISTNGPRSYGHPAPSTIINIVKSCIKKGYNSCDIIFNYKKVADRIILKNTPKGMRINIKHSQSMEIQ